MGGDHGLQAEAIGVQRPPGRVAGSPGHCFAAGQLPDVTIAPDGSLTPLTGLTAMVGLIGHPWGGTRPLLLRRFRAGERRFLRRRHEPVRLRQSRLQQCGLPGHDAELIRRHHARQLALRWHRVTGAQFSMTNQPFDPLRYFGVSDHRSDRTGGLPPIGSGALPNG